MPSRSSVGVTRPTKNTQDRSNESKLLYSQLSGLEDVVFNIFIKSRIIVFNSSHFRRWWSSSVRFCIPSWPCSLGDRGVNVTTAVDCVVGGGGEELKRRAVLLVSLQSSILEVRNVFQWWTKKLNFDKEDYGPEGVDNLESTRYFFLLPCSKRVNTVEKL